MKRFLAFLLVITLFSAAYAFAQEDRHRRGGNGGGDGLDNSNSSGGEKTGNSGDNGGRQQWKDDSKAQNPHRGVNRQPRNPHGLGKTNRGPNLVPGGQGNGLNHHSNRNLNSQNQFPNRQGNQGVGGGNNARLHNDQGGSLNHNQSAAVPQRFQRMGIRSFPQPIQNRSHILATNRQQSVITPPSSGPHGAALRASVLAPRAMTSNIVQTHMGRITSNAAFSAQINLYNRNEVRTNNYYWHNWNGVNYCHYYDTWGYHWYGWYIGSNCFWTRWYYNNWWWYDTAFDRWCYWHDGGWWWQDPYHVNVVYVYNNGNYDSVNSAASDNNGSNLAVYQSNDGTRKVKLMGEGRDAFLYDTSNSPSFDPVFLSTGVKDVKFSDTSNGGPLQVILTLQNGSFEMYDANGNRYNGGNSD